MLELPHQFCRNCFHDYSSLFGRITFHMMSFRCAVEMSDVLAAIVQSGGTHQVDTVYTPQRNLTISFFLGNKEPWYGNGVSWSLSLFDSALTNYPPFQKIVNVHTNSFDFEQPIPWPGIQIRCSLLHLKIFRMSETGSLIFHLSKAWIIPIPMV